MKPKKQRAIFTIVRNESIFLPIWYKYYSNLFDEEDIYVVDDSSIDDSTNFLAKSQVHKIYNEFAYSHEYLKRNVEYFRNELLRRYDYVIFAEVDEILVGMHNRFDDLIDLIIANKRDYATATGYELMHYPELEPDIDLSKKILSQRKFWFRNPLYDKLLISNCPLRWTLGFHDVDGVDKNLYKNEQLILIHLHRFDYKLHMERKLKFAKEYVNDDDPKFGYQNKLKTIEEIDRFYYNIPTKTERIPDEIVKHNKL